MEDPERCEAIRSCRELGEPKAGTDESFLVDLEDVTDGSRAKVSNLTIGPDNIEVFRLAVQVHGVRIRDSVSNLTGRHRADGIDAAIDRLDVPGQRFIAVTRVCEDLSLIEEDYYTVGACDEFRSVLPQEFAALL
jgi:hypothetical protein